MSIQSCTGFDSIKQFMSIDGRQVCHLLWLVIFLPSQSRLGLLENESYVVNFWFVKVIFQNFQGVIFSLWKNFS
jgi:hypothetical protein